MPARWRAAIGAALTEHERRAVLDGCLADLLAPISKGELVSPDRAMAIMAVLTTGQRIAESHTRMALASAREEVIRGSFVTRSDFLHLVNGLASAIVAHVPDVDVRRELIAAVVRVSRSRGHVIEFPNRGAISDESPERREADGIRTGDPGVA